MKIIALDWGEKRVGVAISDYLGIIAQGLTVIEESDFSARLTKIKALIKENQVEELVLGLPFTLKGERRHQALDIQDLVEKLKEELQVPVHLQDERLSTKEVEKLLISFDLSRAKRKKIKDKLSAQLILQTFLDRKRQAQA